MSIPPPLFALLAALLFALSIHVQTFGSKGMRPVRGALISVATSAAFFWFLSPFLIDWAWWGSPATLVFAFCGLMFPAMGQFMQVTSIARVGPAVTASVGAFTPAFATLPAILFLGERLSPLGFVGFALLIGGLAMAGAGAKGQPRRWPLVFLVFPLAAALVRGVVQPIAKVGYATLPEPFFATLVMASVSTVVLLIIAILRRSPVPMEAGPRQIGAFAFSGILNGTGILSLQQAIRLGDVSTAAPLAASTPLFAWLLAAFVFRRQEATARQLVMAGLVVAGAILIIVT